MLSRVSLQNFKASRNVSVRLGQLTILSGLNGSGKSTLLQALAVLKQSYSRTGRIDEMRIRGPLIQLGSFADILADGADTDVVTIEVEEDGRVYVWKISDDAMGGYANLSARPPEGAYPPTLINDNFQVLHADRIVPQPFYSRSSAEPFSLGPLGPRGEFTAELLANSDATREKVSHLRECPRAGLYLTEELMQKVAPTSTLLDQVAGWLQQLSPGARISSKFLSGTDEVVMQYDYVGRAGIGESDRRIRPSNVGFGLTYSLPIIVACLTAKIGSLLLLENPEAHLHPQGQFALGGLIARTAADGVQLIVETHSDHLLNGVRLAVKNGIVRSDQVVPHYFKRDVSTGDVEVQSPAILESGRMAAWPEGFFDQWDVSLDQLLDMHE